MFCSKCGNELSPNARFCSNCGAEVVTEGPSSIKVVSAVCPQCGAKIKVNPDLEASVCEFCGNAILVDRAIQYFYSSDKKFVNNGVFNQAKKDNEYTVELEKAKQKKYTTISLVGIYGALAVIMIALAFMVWALQFL